MITDGYILPHIIKSVGSKIASIISLFSFKFHNFPLNFVLCDSNNKIFHSYQLNDRLKLTRLHYKSAKMNGTHTKFFFILLYAFRIAHALKISAKIIFHMQFFFFRMSSTYLHYYKVNININATLVTLQNIFDLSIIGRIAFLRVVV